MFIIWPVAWPTCQQSGAEPLKLSIDAQPRPDSYPGPPACAILSRTPARARAHVRVCFFGGARPGADLLCRRVARQAQCHRAHRGHSTLDAGARTHREIPGFPRHLGPHRSAREQDRDIPRRRALSVDDALCHHGPWDCKQEAQRGEGRRLLRFVQIGTMKPHLATIEAPPFSFVRLSGTSCVRDRAVSGPSRGSKRHKGRRNPPKGETSEFETTTSAERMSIACRLNDEMTTKCRRTTLDGETNDVETASFERSVGFMSARRTKTASLSRRLVSIVLSDSVLVGRAGGIPTHEVGGGAARNLARIGLPQLAFEGTSWHVALFHAAEPGLGMKRCRRRRLPSKSSPCEADSCRVLGDPSIDLGPVFPTPPPPPWSPFNSHLP